MCNLLRYRFLITISVLFLLLLPAVSFSFALPNGQATTSSSKATVARSSSTSDLKPLSFTTGSYSHFVKVQADLPSFLPSARPFGGVLGGQTPIQATLVLTSRNTLGLEQLIAQEYNNTSPDFHHFLSAGEYYESYGPDSLEALSLISYFASNGVRASQDTSNPFILDLKGSVASFEKSFQVSLGSFEYQNQIFYSPSSSPMLPSQFSNVKMVYGLSNYSTPSAVPLYKVLTKNLVTSPTQTPGNFLYYSPSEIWQAYNTTALINSGFTGSGVTISIIDAYGDPYIQQELDNFSSVFNLPSIPVNVICVDGPCNYSEGIVQGWNLEIALDVEWAHAMAPDAAINLYIGSNSSQPLFDAVEKAVADGTNSIISMSWGSPENDFGASTPFAPVFGQSYPWLDQVLQQAAAQGITTFASSGDWGGYEQALGQTAPYGAVLYPSTDPYVTGVGGTALYMNTTSGYYQAPYFNATGSYGSETAWSWNNAYGWSTGGGYSTFFGGPQWQKGQGLDNSGARGAPDVSWDADVQTGVIVSTFNPNTASFDLGIVGGTSVGSPSWSGALALLEQKAGSRLGLINPELYSIFNNKQEYSKAFHDVTFGNDNPNSAGTGWDPLTGIGSPNVGELADYLAPTGGISVAVQNSLSGQLDSSFAYGSTIQLTANVTGSQSITGLSANITSASGTLISNVPMTFDQGSGKWQGSYTIKSSDPEGEWTATVEAKTAGSNYGVGYTTFSVGGGITLFEPLYNVSNSTFNSHFFETGDSIHITASVTNPDGSCCVTSGSYNAIFTLSSNNQENGKLEGSKQLSYNSTSGYWEGTFKIPSNADQGPWLLTVNGTDPSGNKAASAYYWINVGLSIQLATDSPNYVLGDKMLIGAAPTYEDRSFASNGSFYATISYGSKALARVPLTYSSVYGFWLVNYQTKLGDPSGYYTITVSGQDTKGNYGSFATLVRVAPYSLHVETSMPSPEISISGGNEPYVSAKIFYPNGTQVTQGSIVAYISQDLGGGDLITLKHLRLSYQASTQSFVAPNVLQSLGPETTSLGKYDVDLEAFDPYGNYGNLTTSFYVTGLAHSPISIQDNGGFTTSNGVIAGSGAANDPFIIAGWNTSSITIGSGVSATYELMNNWVEGSSSDGIVLDSSGGPGSLVTSDFAIANSGNGVFISNPSNVYVYNVVANNNTKNGILISGGQAQQTTGTLTSSVAVGNQENGILAENSNEPLITFDYAAGNLGSGIRVVNSLNATVGSNTVIANKIGIEVTASNSSQNYGQALIEANEVLNNMFGIVVDGAGQVSKDPSSLHSFATLQYNTVLNNTLGLYARNQALFQAYVNAFGFNKVGISSENSLPVVADNLINQNFESGLNITGQFASKKECQVVFPNSTSFFYSSCVAGNVFDSNGHAHTGSGLLITNVNGSFVYLNNVTNNANDGLEIQNVSHSTVLTNLISYNHANGVYLSNNSSYVSVNNNTVSSNGQNGMLLLSSKLNTITKNRAQNNAQGCGASHLDCTYAAGINLSGNSTSNLVISNSVESNRANGTSLGFGVLVQQNSESNSIFSNVATQNNAGLGFIDAQSNVATGNTVSNNTYGIYFLRGAQNSYSGNKLSLNQQDIFPSVPIVRFLSPGNDTTANGLVSISWNESGQSISSETISIDGVLHSLGPNATSYQWNTYLIQDGEHVVTVTVKNTGGFTSSTRLALFTNSIALYDHTLTVQVVGPLATPISRSSVTLSNSTSNFRLNSTTDSQGKAYFQRLGQGNYLVSALVNGSVYSSSVYFTTNSTLSIALSTLITTSYGKTSGGTTFPILVNGNITASELSQISLSSSSTPFGGSTLSFKLAGQDGTTGTATLAIPKSQVPDGLIPTVYIDDSRASQQSYTQDQNNYYITLSTHFGSAHTLVEIRFASGIFNIRTIAVMALLIALIAVGIAYIRHNRQKNSKYWTATPSTINQ